jgi:tetratricopeptide (TPR) repeat protein
VIELYKAGRYSEAIPIAQRVLAIREEALGRDHPLVATSLDLLALLYNNQGRYAEAEPLYQRALAINEKALGWDRPNVGSSLNNLAELPAALPAPGPVGAGCQHHRVTCCCGRLSTIRAVGNSGAWRMHWQSSSQSKRASALLLWRKRGSGFQRWLLCGGIIFGLKVVDKVKGSLLTLCHMGQTLAWDTV